MLAFADVADHGNDMLPGYENKGFPDVLTIGIERFQYAFPSLVPRFPKRASVCLAWALRPPLDIRKQDSSIEI